MIKIKENIVEILLSIIIFFLLIIILITVPFIRTYVIKIKSNFQTAEYNFISYTEKEQIAYEIKILEEKN